MCVIGIRHSIPRQQYRSSEPFRAPSQSLVAPMAIEQNLRKPRDGESMFKPRLALVAILGLAAYSAEPAGHRMRMWRSRAIEISA